MAKQVAKPVKRKGYIAGGAIGQIQRGLDYDAFRRQDKFTMEDEDKQAGARQGTEGKAKGGKVKKVIKRKR
jgi:hypothetical protein